MLNYQRVYIVIYPAVMENTTSGIITALAQTGAKSAPVAVAIGRAEKLKHQAVVITLGTDDEHH